MIDYHHAHLDDFKAIQKFIKDYWSHDHILSNDDEVFSHFFLSQKNLQFFIAKESDGDILGILGYITYTQFDTNLNSDIAWLSMWMSKPAQKEPVGIKLIQCLEESLDVDYVASIGVGDQVIPLYHRMGYDTGQMIHLMKPVKEKSNNRTSNFTITDAQDKSNEGTSKKYKSDAYIKEKYLRKKFYDYANFYIYEDNNHLATIVGRVLYDLNSKKNIFRIVDFAGDKKGISIFAKYASFDKFQQKIDFIDVLLSDDSFLEEDTFETCSSQNYLPLYFEPFISEYRKKNYCFKKLNNDITQDLLIITGDCDQERPNKRYNSF